MTHTCTARNRTAAGVLSALLVLSAAGAARASTAAFAGTVIAAEAGPPNDKHCLRRFTVRIGYLDYISWGKFGPHTEIGETITRKVMPQGTVCILNGRLVSAAALAGAVAPGTWGYFYEDTWLDLFTTPDFQWGQVVAHDAAKKHFTLRMHATHKDYHLATNPPRDFVIPYDEATAFAVEAGKSDPAAALKVGHWVQIHKPRPQLVLARTAAAAFDPAELLPHEQGRRGHANDLSCPAMLISYQTRQPEKVIDLAARIRVRRHLGGRWGDVTLDCRKTTFVLDGKVCPIAVAFRPGRHAVLGHYRKETSPHKIFVRSFDDAVRGTIKEAAGDGKSVTVTVKAADGPAAVKAVTLEAGARVWLDGRKSTRAEALEAGRDVTVHPRRGRTVIAFRPYPAD